MLLLSAQFLLPGANPMFAIQSEATRVRSPLKVIVNPSLEQQPNLKAVWERVDGQLTRRWVKA